MDTLIKSINKAMRENDTALFGKKPKKWLYKTTDKKEILVSAITLLQASTRQIKFLESMLNRYMQSNAEKQLKLDNLNDRIIPGVNANELK
tara:strand:+ start:642 stop:914 length:273 start_codon:yes stop_codon:yes gene_type:complete